MPGLYRGCTEVEWVLQFCGLAVIETKNRAMAMVEKLEQQLDLPKKVRIHWTGCPNSCGQVSMRFSRNP